jgi:hypothetical protein
MTAKKQRYPNPLDSVWQELAETCSCTTYDLEIAAVLDYLLQYGTLTDSDSRLETIEKMQTRHLMRFPDLPVTTTVKSA